MGYCDSVSGTGVASGWALDPDVVPNPIQVHIYIDAPAGSGRFAGVATTGIPRPDVNTATGFAGDNGFNFTLGAEFRDGVMHTLYAYAIDNAGGNNPLLGNCPIGFVAH
jgi:hypothetical protein